MTRPFSCVIASLCMRYSSAYLSEIAPPSANLSNSLKRDGKPKKYFTLSFDDGTTQDYRIIEICRKYNFRGITFNINSGLCGANWEWVADMVKVPGTTHIRLTEEEIKSGVYDGFDIAAHTRKHKAVKDTDKNPAGLFRAIEKDVFNLGKLTGTTPIGMAWPNGDNDYTEKSIRNVYKYTSVRYARAATSTGNFNLPERFLRWQPTASIVQDNVLSLAKQFIEADATEDMLFYVWGHGFELDAFNLYDTFEELIKMMSENGDIVCVSNTEFYLLFKEQIPSV